MTSALIALFAFLLVGAGLTFWLRKKQTTATPLVTSAQRNADLLAHLHWREFAKLVLQAMRARGYTPVFEDGQPADGIPTNGSDILLKRGDEFALLACKYGSAAVVDARPLLGLTSSAKLRGATHVIVVTPGRFEEEAVRLANEQQLELIDGEILWPEVRPYVPQPKETVAAAEPTQHAKPDPKMLGLAWAGAAIFAGVVWMLAQGLQPVEPAMPPTIAAAPVAPVVAPQPASTASKADAPAAAQGVNEVPTDPKLLVARRREVANTISTLFGVERALWATQSTLLVNLSAEEADPINELCPLLERYPELAASRIQLQPPSGSKKPVRFKQCRTY